MLCERGTSEPVKRSGVVLTMHDETLCLVDTEDVAAHPPAAPKADSSALVVSEEPVNLLQFVEEAYELENEDRPQVQLAIDMRKTYLRSEILKTRHLSMRLGDYHITLEPRKFVRCVKHKCPIGMHGLHANCDCNPMRDYFEEIVITDPRQRDVKIEKKGAA